MERTSIGKPEGQSSRSWESGDLQLDLYWVDGPAESELAKLRAGASQVTTEDITRDAERSENEPGLLDGFLAFVRLPGDRLVEIRGASAKPGGPSFAEVLPQPELERVLVGAQGAQLVIDYRKSLRIDRFGDESMFHCFEATESLLLMKSELTARAFDLRSLTPMWTYEPDYGAPFSLDLIEKQGVAEARDGIEWKLLDRFDLLQGPTVPRDGPVERGESSRDAGLP